MAQKGRFVSRDPIGYAGDELLNLFRYVRNSPAEWADPNGLKIDQKASFVKKYGGENGILSRLLKNSPKFAALWKYLGDLPAECLSVSVQVKDGSAIEYPEYARFGTGIGGKGLTIRGEQEDPDLEVLTTIFAGARDPGVLGGLFGPGEKLLVSEEDFVRTLTHELLHVLQQARWNKCGGDEKVAPPNLEPWYAHLSDDAFSWIEDVVGEFSPEYRKQQEEKAKSAAKFLVPGMPIGSTSPRSK